MKALERWSRAFRIGRRFTPELIPHRGRLVAVAALMLVVVALELARPWPLRWLFDEVLLPDGARTAAPLRLVAILAGITLAILVSKALVEYVATLALTAVGHAVTRGLRLRIFTHLVELSPAFHARHKSGDLLVRLMGDVPLVKDMLVDASVNISVRLVQVVGTVVVMFVIDPVLGAAVLLPVPVLLLTLNFLSGRLRVAVRKQRRKEGELADYLHEAVAATTLLQSLGRSPHAVRRFARSNRRSARAGLKAARAAARLAASVEVLLAVAFAGAIAFGGWRVVGGHLSAGELIVFLSYVRGISKPVRSAAKNQARVAKGTACGERILDVLDEVIELRKDPGQVVAPEHPRELTYERVGFTYPDGTVALAGVDLTLRRGELVALVGPSGAGKSTLTSLALRVFDPTEGRVLLDGVALPEYRLESLRDRFGLAMQETVLFGESLRENLLLGRLDASEDELWTALRAAGAADVVHALPEGLDTVLGAAGVGLSGGETRRICLARAVLRQSAILIADEPFAGLDAEAAELVCDTLVEYARDRMVVVVTHDRTQLGRFDHVVHLEAGRIVADSRDESSPGRVPSRAALESDSSEVLG